MRKFFSILWAGCMFSSMFSQDIATGFTPSISQNDDAQLLYRNEQVFGILVHSSGWGLNYRRGKHITGFKKRTIETEIVGMKHPKEIKTELSDFGTGRGYFYGKMNVITVVRGGYGYHKVISGKSDRRGVELRLVTLAGPTFAFAKPIYLEIWYPDNNNPGSQRVVEKYDPSNPYHVPYNNLYGIIGKAGYFTGFSEMKIYPGVFFKLGLSFEHSSLDEDIKLLETGVVADAFYKTVPIMANTKNNQVFLNFYINVMFGKKWF